MKTNKFVFGFIIVCFLFFGCNKAKSIANDIKGQIPEIASTVSEKAKEYTDVSINYIKDTASEIIKKIDIDTEIIYSQPELNIIDDSISYIHRFSFKKDLHVSINITPKTKIFETAKEMANLSEKDIPVEIIVRKPENFTVISTGGNISETQVESDTVTKFLLRINNKKNKVYNVILKISGRTEGDVFINIQYGENLSSERDLESNIIQLIKFERR